MSANGMGECLRIQGKVQGVGFRPWIWQLAQQLTLCGDVCNDGAGVEIRLLGSADALVARMHEDCPPLARIDSIRRQPMHWATIPANFLIRQSHGGVMSTQIAPDAATCADCLHELNQPEDHRYAYPFLNCTHCGPRFTIIRAMPYDRSFTVMAAFPLCADCATEYCDPGNRRFHAQPIACPACGPWLSWQQPGSPVRRRQAALQAAIAALLRGDIIAIKGLGGFHLACDATNLQAINRLRIRKQRPDKPLAVMINDAAGLPAGIVQLLTSPAAPIVLIDKTLLPLAHHAILAPGLTEIGVMLPANPLQHLIMQAVKRPLVMTSGNASGNAPALTNEQALTSLAAIADGWLLHNRDIVSRMDDSLLRPLPALSAPVHVHTLDNLASADTRNYEMLRRARGFVPDALPLPPGLHQVPPVLALGADLKNTFCLLRDDEAIISQHFGDLTHTDIARQWQQALQHFMTIYQFVPQRVAVDAHPTYHASQWGRSMGLPVHEILHHHAHVAACLAEHRWPLNAGVVIALTLDGIGFGANSQWWGGECLLADYRHCQHLGGLPAVALPGGDIAARQPWRNLLAHCHAFVSDWQHYSHTAQLQQHGWQSLVRAITRGINCPRASSAGRLFDAVAAALGCAPVQQSYEGQAACLLQALAQQCPAPVVHPVCLPVTPQGQLDLAYFWYSWLNWRANDAQLAWAFHDALAGGLAALARFHARQRGIDTIVCSGGVLHNQLLRQRLAFWLHDFTVLFPQRLPAGDGAISFGQAIIAAIHARGDTTC